MELTVEQRAIVEAETSDLAVRASAGSGKTRVLVERYLRLLQTAAVPEIAAVTFTEAAATEMRDRVRRAVMTGTALARHRSELDEAVIGTIHSLALSLLRDHPVEAAIDPAAVVLAGDEAELLRRTACVEAVDAAAEAGDARTVALREIDVWHAGLQLPLMLAARDDVEAAFAALGPDPTGWLARTQAVLRDSYKAEQAQIRSEVAGIEHDITRAAPSASGSLAEVASDVLAALEGSGDCEWPAFVEALAVAKGRTNLRPGRREPPDVVIKDAFRRLRELVKEAGALPAWNEYDGRALEALAGLRDLFDDASRRYAAAKRERHALDFLDLETGAVALLRDHPRVATEVRGRFRHLMVDEAQDVNPLQAELIRLLAGEGEEGAPRPRVFLVGDDKQSIYRFRGAHVECFADLCELVTGRGGSTLPLSRSFRAHDRLVGNLNALFAAVFANATEPFEAAMEAMAGRPAPPPGGGPYLTLMPVGNKAPSDESTTDHDRRRVEADIVASEIAALLTEGRDVWDRATGEVRPARPGDVAVLLRRFTNVHTFEQALEACGVPYTTPSGTGFFTRQEVLDCGHLLRWLAEPHDEIALAGVLRSPFFALADGTLLALRKARRALIVALHDPPEDVIGAERARCEHAAGVLHELREAARAASAEALLELALERSGVEAAWAPIEGGDQARANIRKLVRTVRTLAGHSLPEVVEYLEQRRDDLDAREAPAALDQPDAVQVMTVHAAKGLEFPVVFVPEAHIGPQTTWPAVRWRRDDGVSVTLQRGEDDRRRPRPGFYAHLLRRDQLEEAAEHRRLFYVAATRAGDYLYLSGDKTDKDGWLAAALGVFESEGASTSAVRPAAAVDVEAVARRSVPTELRLGGDRDEVEYTAPLLARPRVIPLRASTPVTALRPPADAPPHSWRADDRRALLGKVAHRAIEEAGGAVGALDLGDIVALVQEESERMLDGPTACALAEEVTPMLARFSHSPTAAALAAPGVERWFELPFAWDWEGLPLHGVIDLVYRDTTGWHVIDFKTDRIDGAGVREYARRYFVQAGVYQRAIEAAVGERPAAGLLFLRTGELIEATPEELDAALAEARARVDAGATLAPEPFDLPDELD